MQGLRRQPQGGKLRPHASIGADFSWLASVGTVVGPPCRFLDTTTNTVKMAGGLALTNGYASLENTFPSLQSRTWTEFGTVHLNGAGVITVSARNGGQPVQFLPSTNRINVVCWGVVDINISGVLPTGIVHYVVRRNGTSYTAWVNGKLFGTTTNTAIPNSVSQKPAVGAQASSGTYGGVGITPEGSGILAVTRTAQVLSDDMCQRLSANPWQAFADPEEEDESLLRKTAVSSSIAVTATSLLLGGGQVALRVSRRVGVQASQLGVTTGSASLRSSRKIPAAPVALSMTGGTVAMRAARRVSVAVAGLAIQSGAVQLRASRRLTVAPVEMAVTGSTISFVFTPAPGAGSYAVSVTATALSLTGGNVGMRVTRRLPVAPVALALPAGSIRLMAGRRIIVGFTALQVDQGQVLMRAQCRLQVVPAQLVSVGSAVTLRYSSQVEYARAPAGAGYAPAAVAVQARPVGPRHVRPSQMSGFRPPATQRNRR